MNNLAKNWDAPIQTKSVGMDVLLETACIATERVLALQTADGIFRVPDKLVNESFHHHNHQIIYNLARLYRLKHPLNSLRARTDVLRAAIRSGDALTEDYRQKIQNKSYTPHRELYCWIQALKILREEIGVRRKKRWERVLYGCSRSLLPEIKDIRPKLDVPFYYPNIICGRGFNHISLTTALVYIIGKYFKDASHTSLASDTMRMLVKTQRPEGYWSEYNGPSPFLNYITLEGVQRYYAASGDRSVLRFIRKAVEFNVRCLFPDMSIIANLDDRVQFDRRPTGQEVLAWGLGAFAHIPVWGLAAAQHSRVGRAYLGEVIDKLPQRLSRERLCAYLEFYVLLLQAYDAIPRSLRIPGKSERRKLLPFLKRSSKTILRRNALVEKKNRWVLSLSGIVSPTVGSSSRFCIDRQSFLSLFHQDAGHIIIGSNSKRQPGAATFRAKSMSGQDVYLPRGSELDPEKRKLHLFYDDFAASIQISLLSLRKARITLSLLRFGAENVEANLILGAFFDDIVMFRSKGAETSRKLGKKQVKYVWSKAGAVCCNGWELAIPEGGRFAWPFSPFYSYTDDQKSPARRSWAVLSIPLQGRVKEWTDTEIEVAVTFF